MAKKKEESFETAIAKLEKIVSELETGELPLEKALAGFEEGMRISRDCSEKLDAAESRITLLSRSPDGVVTENPFPLD